MLDDQNAERHTHPLERRVPAAPGPAAPRPPQRRSGPRLPLVPPWVTLTLLAINVGIFALGTLLPVVGRQLFQYGASRSYEVLVQGEVQRLFTAMFLHAGMMHLFFNMYALYIIGRGVEGLCGHARFLLIYLLGGLTGSLLSVALGSPDPWLSAPSVGASGAVFAIFGAEMVWLFRHRTLLGAAAGRQLRSLLMLLGVNLAFGLLRLGGRSRHSHRQLGASGRPGRRAGAHLGHRAHLPGAAASCAAGRATARQQSRYAPACGWSRCTPSATSRWSLSCSPSPAELPRSCS